MLHKPRKGRTWFFVCGSKIHAQLRQSSRKLVIYLGDFIAQAINLMLEESTFIQIQCNTGTFQYRKNFLHVFYVILVEAAEEDDIIEIYKTVLPVEHFQHDIHSPMERFNVVTQAVPNYFKLVAAGITY